jgi:hypothetical protein
MSVDVQEMGPVDYMVVEFPGGRMTGEGLPLLVDLSDRGIIRILDLVFIRKLQDGSFVRIDLSDRVDGKDALRVFEGAASGLLDDDDIAAAADVVQPGSMAGMIVYENRWAAPLATTLRRGGAMLVASGRIPIQALLAAIDAAEAASQPKTSR